MNLQYPSQLVRRDDTGYFLDLGAPVSLWIAPRDGSLLPCHVRIVKSDLIGLTDERWLIPSSGADLPPAQREGELGVRFLRRGGRVDVSWPSRNEPLINPLGAEWVAVPLSFGASPDLLIATPSGYFAVNVPKSSGLTLTEVDNGRLELGWTPP